MPCFKFDREAYDQRMAWYTDARFGMFIHWGLYAIPARGEVGAQRGARCPRRTYMPYLPPV